ncbi:hypothetical protein ACFLV5_03050 [Chloroflexota bacterium]
MWLFRRRKYPLKSDEKGLSARQRAFELFGEGKRPSQVCNTLPISLRTACRYFEDFKKLHHKVPYATIRKWMRDNQEFSDKVIGMLADSLEMSREEVVTRMQKPWGLMEAMKGKWPDYRLEREQREIESRLYAALEVVRFTEIFGQNDPGTVRETLTKMIMDRNADSPEA